MNQNPLDTKRTKPKVTLLCPFFIEELTKLMTHYKTGKYSELDYKKETREKDLYLDAISRHLLAILKGEDIDKEDGFLHILKIASNCMMLYNNHYIKEVDKILDEQNSEELNVKQQTPKEVDEKVLSMSPEGIRKGMELCEGRVGWIPFKKIY